MFFQKKKTKVIAVLLVLVMIWSMVTSVVSQEPYISYGYDWWWDTYPVQAGYVVDRVITGNDIIVDGERIQLDSPQDIKIFVDSDEFGEVYEILFFIADTRNNRIIITDEDFKNARVLDEFFYGDDYQVQNFMNQACRDCQLDKCLHECNSNCYDDDEKHDCQNICAVITFWEEAARVQNNETTKLSAPTGIHIIKTQSGDLRIYIADHDNSRVIASDLNGSIWMEYRRPASASYPSNISFNPSKVLVDNAGNVYVAIRTITRGAVKFSERGHFLGYYGANRVTQTADAILNYFLRFVLTREQMQGRRAASPVEFSNFTIDNDQFIYTVTKSRSANSDIVTKLDPAGRNVFAQQGFDDMVWGDFNQPHFQGKTYASLMIDISVDENGDIYLFDEESGKIFQYDKEGNLMFIFGGKGEQKGLFRAPTALETYGSKVYALDSIKNSITVFKLTEFGGLVVQAMGDFNRGRYIESMEPWQEVLRRDANYYMAYVGMGNAKLSVGQFEEALDYFYMHSRGGYNRAFKDFRINYIRDNFDRMLAVALIAVGLLIAVDGLFKIRRNKKNQEELYAQYN
jgi:antitoxin component HigA of HigAB toxin-antitoxin module